MVDVERYIHVMTNCTKSGDINPLASNAILTTTGRYVDQYVTHITNR